MSARVRALAGDGADAEVERLARAARDAHRDEPGSPWSRPSASATRPSSTPRASGAIAGALAQVARLVAAGVVIAKGGITVGRDRPRRPRRRSRRA